MPDIGVSRHKVPNLKTHGKGQLRVHHASIHDGQSKCRQQKPDRQRLMCDMPVFLQGLLRGKNMPHFILLVMDKAKVTYLICVH